jgi:L-ribulose-5-phosphate 3-epimerase
MKLAVCELMFPAGQPVEHFLDLARDCGLDGVELAMDTEGRVLTPETTRAEAEALRVQLERRGLAAACLCSRLNWSVAPLAHPDPVVRQRGRDVVAKLIELAAWLGAPSVMVIPAVVQQFGGTRVIGYGEAWEQSQAALRALAPVAAERGVVLAVEYIFWNRFILSPVELARFVDEIGHPSVRVYFDAGNVVPLGFPEDWVRVLGSRIQIVHVKDARRRLCTDGIVQTGLLQGDVNWPAVMASLRAVGYDGWLSAEVRLWPEPNFRAAEAALHWIAQQ